MIGEQRWASGIQRSQPFLSSQGHPRAAWSYGAHLYSCHRDGERVVEAEQVRMITVA